MRLLETSWFTSVHSGSLLSGSSVRPHRPVGWNCSVDRFYQESGWVRRTLHVYARGQTVDHLEPQSRRAPPWPLTSLQRPRLPSQQLFAAGPVACWKTKAICGAGGGEGVPAWHPAVARPSPAVFLPLLFRLLSQPRWEETRLGLAHSCSPALGLPWLPGQPARCALRPAPRQLHCRSRCEAGPGRGHANGEAPRQRGGHGKS